MGGEQTKDKSEMNWICYKMILKWLSNLERQILVFILLLNNHRFKSDRKIWVIGFFLSKNFGGMTLLQPKKGHGWLHFSSFPTVLICTASPASKGEGGSCFRILTTWKNITLLFQRLLASHQGCGGTDICQVPFIGRSGGIWVALMQRPFLTWLFDKGRDEEQTQSQPLLAQYSARESLQAQQRAHYNMEPVGVTTDKTCRQRRGWLGKQKRPVKFAMLMEKTEVSTYYLQEMVSDLVCHVCVCTY